MATEKIKYTGEFDVSGILNSLKQISSQMKNMSTDVSLFSGVDKDFEKLDKMIIDIKAKIAQGFSSSKSVDDLSRQMDQFYTSLTHVQTELKEISNNSDFKLKGVDEAEQKLAEMNKQLESFSKKAKSDLETAFKGFGLSSTDAKALANQIKDAETLKQKLKEITEQRQKDLDKAKEQAATKIATAQSKAGKTLLTPLKAKDIGGVKGPKEQGEVADILNSEVANQMKDVLNGSAKIEDVWEDIVKKAQQLGVTLNNQEAIQNKLQDAYNKMKTTMQDATSEVEDAVAALVKIGEVNTDGEFIPSGDATTLIGDFDSLQQKIQESENEIIQLKQKIAELENNNATAKIAEDLEDVGNNARESQTAMADVNQETKELTESQQRLDNSFENMKDTVKTFLSIGSAINAIKNVVRQTFEDIKGLDKSFASIAMVTDYSVKQMWESYDQYAEMANRLGQSTEDVIASSALFYQQGLDTAEALSLTENTMKLATLAGSDFATATSQMTAA